MRHMLGLDNMKHKIATLVQIETAQGCLRPEVALPIYHLFAAGPLGRGEFIQMTGLGERTGRNALAAALKCGIVTAQTSHSPIKFAMPIDALPILMPHLYASLDN